MSKLKELVTLEPTIYNTKRLVQRIMDDDSPGWPWNNITSYYDHRQQAMNWPGTTLEQRLRGYQKYLVRQQILYHIQQKILKLQQQLEEEEEEESEEEEDEDKVEINLLQSMQPLRPSTPLQPLQQQQQQHHHHQSVPPYRAYYDDNYYARPYYLNNNDVAAGVYAYGYGPTVNASNATNMLHATYAPAPLTTYATTTNHDINNSPQLLPYAANNYQYDYRQYHQPYAGANNAAAASQYPTQNFGCYVYSPTRDTSYPRDQQYYAGLQYYGAAGHHHHQASNVYQHHYHQQHHHYHHQQQQQQDHATISFQQQQQHDHSMIYNQQAQQQQQQQLQQQDYQQRQQLKQRQRQLRQQQKDKLHMSYQNFMQNQQQQQQQQQLTHDLPYFYHQQQPQLQLRSPQQQIQLRENEQQNQEQQQQQVEEQVPPTSSAAYFPFNAYESGGATGGGGVGGGGGGFQQDSEMSDVFSQNYLDMTSPSVSSTTDSNNIIMQPPIDDIKLELPICFDNELEQQQQQREHEQIEDHAPVHIKLEPDVEDNEYSSNQMENEPTVDNVNANNCDDDDNDNNNDDAKDNNDINLMNMNLNLNTELMIMSDMSSVNSAPTDSDMSTPPRVLIEYPMTSDSSTSGSYHILDLNVPQQDDDGDNDNDDNELRTPHDGQMLNDEYFELTNTNTTTSNNNNDNNDNDDYAKMNESIKIDDMLSINLNEQQQQNDKITNVEEQQQSMPFECYNIDDDDDDSDETTDEHLFDVNKIIKIERATDDEYDVNDDNDNDDNSKNHDNDNNDNVNEPKSDNNDNNNAEINKKPNDNNDDQNKNKSKGDKCAEHRNDNDDDDDDDDDNDKNDSSTSETSTTMNFMAFVTTSSDNATDNSDAAHNDGNGAQPSETIDDVEMTSLQEEPSTSSAAIKLRPNDDKFNLNIMTCRFCHSYDPLVKHTPLHTTKLYVPDENSVDKLLSKHVASRRVCKHLKNLRYDQFLAVQLKSKDNAKDGQRHMVDVDKSLTKNYIEDIIESLSPWSLPHGSPTGHMPIEFDGLMTDNSAAAGAHDTNAQRSAWVAVATRVQKSKYDNNKLDMKRRNVRYKKRSEHMARFMRCHSSASWSIIFNNNNNNNNNNNTNNKHTMSLELGYCRMEMKKLDKPHDYRASSSSATAIMTNPNPLPGFRQAFGSTLIGRFFDNFELDDFIENTHQIDNEYETEANDDALSERVNSLESTPENLTGNSMENVSTDNISN